MPIFAAIVASVFLFLGFAHVNYLGCQTALCKQAARVELADKHSERKFKLVRSEVEAPRRLDAELADREATRARLARESEARLEEAKAARERAHDLEMAKIQAMERSEARKDVIAAAEAKAKVVRAQADSRPRQQFSALRYMTDNGMGQPRRRMVRRPPPGYGMPPRRQPRYEMVLKCGIPGRMHQC